MLKPLGVLLFVAVLVSCQDKEAERVAAREAEKQKIMAEREAAREAEKQKIMVEVERYDLLRQKAKEFITAQEAALSAKTKEYEAWKAGRMAILLRCERAIESAEIELEKDEPLLDFFQQPALAKSRQDMARSHALAQIKHLTAKINAAKKEIAQARDTQERVKRQITEQGPIRLKQIVTLKKDLRLSQATYDSLNSLHTIEVGKLAKFGSEQ